jgi:hypothetical protein
MRPEVWGPVLWRAIHDMALAYPERPSPEDARSVEAFFRALPALLPCAACGEKLRAELLAEPVSGGPARSRAALYAWTVRLHNRVNARLGKPEMGVAEALRAGRRVRPPPLWAVMAGALSLGLLAGGVARLARNTS